MNPPCIRCLFYPFSLHAVSQIENSLSLPAVNTVFKTSGPTHVFQGLPFHAPPRGTTHLRLRVTLAPHLMSSRRGGPDIIRRLLLRWYAVNPISGCASCEESTRLSVGIWSLLMGGKTETVNWPSTCSVPVRCNSYKIQEYR